MPIFTGPGGPVSAQQQTNGGTAFDQYGHELIYKATDWLVTDQNGNVTVIPDAQFRLQYPGEGLPTVTAGGPNTAGAAAAGSDAQAGQASATAPAAGMAAGPQATVTYATAPPTAPRAVLVMPLNAATAATQPFVTINGTASFTIGANVAPAASTALSWAYVVIV